MAHGPDWSSDSEDSLLGDDGDYHNFKNRFKPNNISIVPKELTEEEKKEENKTVFFNAVSSGSIETVKEFISKGFDVNLGLRDGWTGLMLAASYGNCEMAKILIEAGAKVDRDRDAVTLLMMACSCPDYTSSFDKSFEVVKLLVENGVNVQAINRKRMDALMYAACNGNLQAVEYLLPKANKQAVDNQRWNALTWAVSNNQPEVVKFLWENGFDVTLVDVRGNTPLDIARDNGLDDIVGMFPKQDDDFYAELVRRLPVSFEENFENLSKGQKPAFIEDMYNILLAVRCSHLTPLFLEQNITIDQFLAMDEDDLKRVGVLLPFQRSRILTGLHRFHKQPYHPKSLHVCVKNLCYSNVDVATALMSAVKQVISMEASLRYLLKHLERQELSKEDKEMITRNISNIKLKIKNLKAVVSKLDARFKKMFWQEQTVLNIFKKAQIYNMSRHCEDLLFLGDLSNSSDSTIFATPPSKKRTRGVSKLCLDSLFLETLMNLLTLWKIFLIVKLGSRSDSSRSDYEKLCQK